MMKPGKLTQTILALAILLLALGLPRWLALDRLVTPDEVNWLTASANFYLALAEGDFSKTYQLEHPGVTTLWAGAAGFQWRYPDYRYEGPGQLVYWEQEAGLVLRSLGHEPLELITAGRFFMILATVIVLAAAFLQAVPLLGFWQACVGFLLVALDPFHIAHARLLHQDGLASSLVLLALLAFLNYLYRPSAPSRDPGERGTRDGETGGGRWRDLLLSGAAAGLAWLTKSPMLFLIPFMGLLVLIELEKRRRMAGRLEKKELQWAAQGLVVWGATGLAVFVLLWPAMWVEPVYTLRRVLGAMLSFAAHGHTEAQLFFNGVIYTGNPGSHFYPITYLWRTTPAVMAGLVVSGFALAAPRTRLVLPAQRRPLAMLLLFALLFTLFMDLGAKKFDRYLLPIYLPLDLVAGVGWIAAANWILRRQPGRWAQASAVGIVLAALVGQAALAVSSSPYYLSYYNPLLGGTRRAPEVMMVGWGEGLDQAAHFLNSQSTDYPPEVMLGLWSGTFSYFYDGTIHWSSFTPGETTIRDWLDSDYCVLYVNQWQRERLPYELVEYLAKKEPAFVVRLQGLDYAYVYDLNHIPPPDYLFAGQEDGMDANSQAP